MSDRSKCQADPARSREGKPGKSAPRADEFRSPMARGPAVARPRNGRRGRFSKTVFRAPRPAIADDRPVRVPFFSAPERFATNKRALRSTRFSFKQNRFSSRLPDIGGAAPCQFRHGSSPTGNKPCRRASRRRIVREARRPATRYAASGVYLVRSAQYQFCNCGVLSISARRDVRLAFQPTLGSRRARWLRKRRRRKRKPARRKRSSLHRYTSTFAETHQSA
jgi:hypothetical protein